MEITLIKALTILFMLTGMACADPIINCQYGGTMVLTVNREEYKEEPDSIFKVVVWNGETSGTKFPNFVTCEVNELVTIEYQHTPNNIIIGNISIPLPVPQDVIRATVLSSHYTIMPNRVVNENTRQVFYIYEAPLG